MASTIHNEKGQKCCSLLDPCNVHILAMIKVLQRKKPTCDVEDCNKPSICHTDGFYRCATHELEHLMWQKSFGRK